MNAKPPGWFQRYLLPGLAFKAVVIGGGYATGRELAEFFLPSGPRGGVMGMLLAMLIWSAVCAATFALAHAARAYDYRSFFRLLLGPAWPAFEVAYMVFMVLLLAVFGAAAGNVANAMFGWPLLAGTLGLMLAVGVTTAFGSQSVERLFKWASVLLYAVYAVFLVLALSSFGGQVVERFGTVQDTKGWAMAGITYASYNVIGAVVILPVARHFLRRRDAVVAGVIAGPLAMLPALLFFVCMAAWYPTIGNEALPSDFMLRKLDMPVFHLLFQAMIFVALLESGVGVVHALNERVAVAWEARRGVVMPHAARFALAAVLLTGSIFVADYFGLVALIANGYRALAWTLLALFVLPLFTVGLRTLHRVGPHPRMTQEDASP
ncbi:YkvI family membrane protein [Thermomonas carbonis]|uniref:Membrane protein YkvI n=1 Tax=Thermomonas carbonis TaxID=1463158 RepID=A0A7G9SLS1_9GAMM|nr:hypothetical protein [Thermomonas carbonis]QNN68796.1 hypothetical protein H9L16_08555 [Thermomonas carbonis]GHC08706.1 hypothetical protein GCM10010080_24660 [Thermomonas carbonis]